MSRITTTFAGGLDRVSIDVSGLPLAPRDYYSVSLINLTIPFSFPNDSSGLLLMSLETQPNVAIVNGICHRYSWCIPFDEPAIIGRFNWYAQSSRDDRVTFKVPRFMSRILIELKYVTPTQTCAFPPLQPGHLASMELLIE